MTLSGGSSSWPRTTTSSRVLGSPPSRCGPSATRCTSGCRSTSSSRRRSSRPRCSNAPTSCSPGSTPSPERLTALARQEVEQQLVHLSWRFQLHPVAGTVQALVAPRPGHVLGGISHLDLGERPVAGAPDAHRGRLDRRELQRRGNPPIGGGVWPGGS